MSQSSVNSSPLSSVPSSSQLFTPVGISSYKARIALPDEVSGNVVESGIALGSSVDFSPIAQPSTPNYTRAEVVLGSPIASSPIQSPGSINHSGSALPELDLNAPAKVEAGLDSPASLPAATQFSLKDSSKSDSTAEEVQPTVTSEPIVTPDSPASTISIMAETRAQKRARQDDGDEGTPPLKKPATTRATKPKAKGKAKTTTRHTPEETASSNDAQKDDNHDELPAKPAATPKVRVKPPPKKTTPTSNDDSDSSSAFEKPIARPKRKPTPSRKKPSSKKPTPKKPTPTNDPKDKDPTPSTNPKPAPKPKAPKKPVPPPPSSTRPTRTCNPPSRLNPAPPAAAKPAPKPPSSKVFDPVYITTHPTSRLVKADTYHLLLSPLAWSALTAAQRTRLVSMLPPSGANRALLDRLSAGEDGDGDGDGEEDTRPAALTVNNDCFRTDVAKFQADLENGHLGKTWQGAAERAVRERAGGEFDAWKEGEGERWWGQKGGV
ncbi:hypothetical protein P153DRAFT_386212 [Dothidotthia symphoricarpi CBS 119687]|uniref:ASX DEUBAD domain-containing protein n=1 Tax=Dothidotthia symphoricarpi CBS 119687 TaxID=1392245 RepID=A0A6A6ADK4_9PLEO|nr:uncharacterized protein P153DRAFT_386212 [Dothidotthia symphoricarpi CBS 119687]KAF2129018.1 hypothetical protein P153DRAFT_386212 [Dothidotthia symphoricarpi CBS 119687]